MERKNSEVKLVCEAKVKTCWPGASATRTNMKRMWRVMVLMNIWGKGSRGPMRGHPVVMGLCPFQALAHSSLHYLPNVLTEG